MEPHAGGAEPHESGRVPGRPAGTARPPPNWPPSPRPPRHSGFPAEHRPPLPPRPSPSPFLLPRAASRPTSDQQDLTPDPLLLRRPPRPSLTPPPESSPTWAVQPPPGPTRDGGPRTETRAVPRRERRSPDTTSIVRTGQRPWRSPWSCFHGDHRSCAQSRPWLPSVPRCPALRAPVTPDHRITPATRGCFAAPTGLELQLKLGPQPRTPPLDGLQGFISSRSHPLSRPPCAGSPPSFPGAISPSPVCSRSTVGLCCLLTSHGTLPTRCQMSSGLSGAAVAPATPGSP